MKFDEHQLTQALHVLSHKHRVAFAASCCERLVPNYRAFVVVERWGDPDLLQQALDEIWRFVEGDSLLEAHVRKLIQAISTVIPHTEDFSSIFVGEAGTAAAAVIYTLECCLDGDAQRAAIVGRLAIDSIESYLTIVNEVSLAEVQYHHPTLSEAEWLQQTLSFQQWVAQEAPLMIAELDQQQWDLEQLRSCADLTRDMLGNMRRLSSTVGIQPFARGIARESETGKE